MIGHNESLSNPYHRERVASLRTQTHGDWNRRDMANYRARQRRSVPVRPGERRLASETLVEMSTRRRRVRSLEVPVLAVVALVSVIALALGLVNVHFRQGPDPYGPPARLTVAQTPGQAIPTSFLGLSLEYSAITSYGAAAAGGKLPLFEQLVRNLSPGQRPSLRIGGDSADETWWPAPGIPCPPGVTLALDSRWIDVAQALTRDLDPEFVLGLNLEAGDVALARTEAQALRSRLGARPIAAFQLGNEPELYGTFAWYRAADGRGVPGREPDYGFEAFVSDFRRVAAQLPPVPLAGPTTGVTSWLPQLDRFLAAAPAVRLVTVHRYPLQLCFIPRHSPRYPSVPHLLSEDSSTGFAATFAAPVAVAHARGLPLRIDELNSVSCGAAPGISRTFASALWALDTLFALAEVGVDGVNIHTFPFAGYELFPMSRTAGTVTAAVQPEYYGLMLFAAAAPPGARLLAVSGSPRLPIKGWATVTGDGRRRIVLINEDPLHTRAAEVSVAGARARATLERLEAPSAQASTGVTLGGRTFGTHTATGRLTGPPRTDSVGSDRGTYRVTLAPTTAALLTVP